MSRVFEIYTNGQPNAVVNGWKRLLTSNGEKFTVTTQSFKKIPEIYSITDGFSTHIDGMQLFKWLRENRKPTTNVLNG